MASAHGVRLPFTFLLEPSLAEPRIYSTGVAALQAPRLGARARSHAGSVGARQGACRHRPLPSFVPFHPSPLHHRDLSPAPQSSAGRSIRSAGGRRSAHDGARSAALGRWRRGREREGGGDAIDGGGGKCVDHPLLVVGHRALLLCFERERERKRQSSRAVNQPSLAVGPTPASFALDRASPR